MRLAKGFFVMLAVLLFSLVAQAQQPEDFLQLASASEGVWNNVTYGTTGPLLMSGEFNQSTGLFSIEVTTPGGSVSRIP